MPILQRIQRIARANITQLLNQAERPEEELETTIRELATAANDAKDALASFAVTYKRLEKNVTNQRQAIIDWQSAATTALQAGEEDNARKALAQRLRCEERLQKTETVLDSRRKTYDELKRNLVQIHDQLNQANARRADLTSRKLAAQAEETMGRQLDEVSHIRDRSFDRLEEDVLQAEARTEIEREIRGDLKPLTQRMAEQAHQFKLDDALAQLKKGLTKETA